MHMKCGILQHMEAESDQQEVVVGPQGRLVIPARYRKALNLQPGEKMVLRLIEGTLLLERPADIRNRLLSRYRKLTPGTNLADELIQDRREEARRESTNRTS